MVCVGAPLPNTLMIRVSDLKAGRSKRTKPTNPVTETDSNGLHPVSLGILGLLWAWHKSKRVPAENGARDASQNYPWNNEIQKILNSAPSDIDPKELNQVLDYFRNNYDDITHLNCNVAQMRLSLRLNQQFRGLKTIDFSDSFVGGHGSGNNVANPDNVIALHSKSTGAPIGVALYGGSLPYDANFHPLITGDKARGAIPVTSGLGQSFTVVQFFTCGGADLGTLNDAAPPGYWQGAGSAFD